MSELPPLHSPSTTEEDAGASAYQEPRILLVDDDEVLRMVQAHFLRRFGYSVDAAADGTGAIKHLDAQAADLVITDMVMPGTDGVQLIQHLKRCHPDVKILAISGGGPVQPHLLTDIARVLGADATLMKPFTLIALLKTVRSLLPPRRPDCH